jgi:multidrug efflux pump subunit AcrA (membrane-fusion protein)
MPFDKLLVTIGGLGAIAFIVWFFWLWRKEGVQAALLAAGVMGAVKDMKSIMKKKLALGVALLALAALVLAVWMVWRPLPPAPGILEANGRIEGDQAAVGAKVGGKIVRLTVREGDSLEPGALRALRLLRAQPSLARASLFGRRVHVLVGDTTAAKLMIEEVLKAAGLAIEHLEQTPLSLEDLFVIFIDMEEQRRRESGG